MADQEYVSNKQVNLMNSKNCNNLKFCILQVKKFILAFVYLLINQLFFATLF